MQPASRRAIKHKGNAERGSAMVEFALVFMILFTMVTLVVQGGFFFGSWLAVTNGAREGARFGAPCLNRNVSPCTPAQIQAVVHDRISGLMDPSYPPVITVQVDSGGEYVTVTVTGTVSNVGPIPLSLPIYGVSRMRLEVKPPLP